MSVHRPFAGWIGAAVFVCVVASGCSASNTPSGTGAVGGAGGAAGYPSSTGGAGVQPVAAGGTPGASNPPMSMVPMPGTGGIPLIPGVGAGGAPSSVTPIGAGGAAGAGVMPGAGGSPVAMPTGTTMPPAPGMCPDAPAGAPASAVQARTTLNQIRLAAGAGCMNLVAALDTSATAHCNYEAANGSNATCTSDPHGEVMSCTGYTGATAQAREIAAGYPAAMAYTEVLTTYGNNPVAAVPSWIDTVWHRIPLLDPWTTDMGYGGAARCDVIDIGRGTSSVPTDAVAVYPYDGQTNVPPTFSGLEGPAPPAPSGGFPSSYPINIYAQRLSVTEHVLTKDGDTTPIDHLWLDAQSSLVSAGLKGYFTDTAFLYGAPFAPNTKYHVKIVGTHTGGALNKEWTFTTGATRPFGT